jgi:hypothetical protein
VHTLLRLTTGIFYADGVHERTETDRFRAFSHDEVTAAGHVSGSESERSRGTQNSAERPVRPPVVWAAHERGNGRQRHFAADQ